MKFLSSQHLNKRNWDQLVASDEQLDFFSLSWVQEILHPEWEVLCDDNGNQLLNLPIGRKFGFRYRLQPFFIRSFQIPSHYQDQFPEIIECIQNSSSYTHLNFQHSHKSEFSSFGSYQALNLNREVSEIKNHYSENAKRILKKQSNLLECVSITEISDFIAFFKTQKGSDLIGFTPEVWERLKLLLTEAQKRGMVLIRSIMQENELLASGAFISFKGILYFLKGTATEKGKKQGAMYVLIDDMITNHHDSHHTLDFIGSNNASIAQFYRKFGAIDYSYGILKKNNLPLLIRRLKA